MAEKNGALARSRATIAVSVLRHRRAPRPCGGTARKAGWSGMFWPGEKGHPVVSEAGTCCPATAPASGPRQMSPVHSR